MSAARSRLTDDQGGDRAFLEMSAAQIADEEGRRVRQRVFSGDPEHPEQQISALLECLSQLKEAVPNLKLEHIPAVQKALMELEIVKGRLNARAEVLAQSKQSTRSNFLRTLSEIIGPAPTDRKWQDEWTELTLDFFRIDQKKPDAAEADILKNLFGKSELQTLIEDKRHLIEQDLSDPELCWEVDESTIVQLLTRRRQPLARSLGSALKSRTKAVRFSASLHALCETLFTVAAKQRSKSKHVQACPSMFKHLYGEFSLEAQDEGWASIGYGDQYGFRGLTSLSATEVNCGKGNFGFAGADRELKQTDFGFGSGFAQAVTDAKGTRYVVQNSPVVEFISKVADSDGMHAPIFLGAGKRDGLPSVAVYPPNTLFRLREVIERSFTIDENGAVCPSGTPNSLEIKQPLYRVTATFISTTAIRSPGNDGGSDQVVTESKTVSQPTMLQYSDRTAFIDGLNSLLLSPSLTMEQEFSREMSWTDRRGGVEHTLVGEWKYVNGKAKTTHIAGVGWRDVAHEGWLPEDFRDEANQRIRTRREEDKTLKDRLQDEHAYLSLDEILAIRLYSGPAFAPINIFLRQLGKLSGIFKTELARHAGITFIHTTKHIMAGIRKLSAIMMDDEMEGFLYRGVRGQLPHSFWSVDEQGKICATEIAFMSTSRDRNTPLQYMDAKGANVLWKLRIKPPSDGHFHCGADISLLSQFSHEKEVLFPPYTVLMLERQVGKEVSSNAPGAPASGAAVMEVAAENELMPERPTAPGAHDTGIELAADIAADMAANMAGEHRPSTSMAVCQTRTRQDLFSLMDRNRDGTLTGEEIGSFFREHDLDGNGKIDRAEFAAALGINDPITSMVEGASKTSVKYCTGESDYGSPFIELLADPMFV